MVNPFAQLAQLTPRARRRRATLRAAQAEVEGRRAIAVYAEGTRPGQGLGAAWNKEADTVARLLGIEV